MPTERTEVILPHLHSVVGKFGAPCAIMRDLGRAIIPACNDLLSELELDIPVLSCHQHFLRDIGTDLLDSAHGKLRELFRRFKIRPGLRDIAEGRNAVRAWQEAEKSRHTLPEGNAGIAVVRALAQWVLDYPADSQYQSFPFDRPYLDFYERCLRARRAADTFLRMPPADRKVCNCPDYVTIVCGSLDRLPRAFAELDAAQRRMALATPPSATRDRSPYIPELVRTSLPAVDRHLIRTEGMVQRIDVAARDRSPRTAARRSLTSSATAN